jgi:hypothetical protein
MSDFAEFQKEYKSDETLTTYDDAHYQMLEYLKNTYLYPVIYSKSKKLIIVDGVPQLTDCNHIIASELKNECGDNIKWFVLVYEWVVENLFYVRLMLPTVWYYKQTKTEIKINHRDKKYKSIILEALNRTVADAGLEINCDDCVTEFSIKRRPV